MTPLLWIRLGVVAVAGILLALFLWWAHGIYEKARRLPDVELELAQVKADLTQYKSDLLDAQEASNAYQNELSTLRVAAARERVPVVRLCKPARVPERRPLPPAGAGPAATTAASGNVSETDSVSRDIGPELFGLADRADELSAQVRGLQAYALACSTP